MAEFLWTGAVDTAFGTAGNWTPAGPPATGDLVTIDGRSVRGIAGSDQHTIVLAALYIKAANIQNIGSTATPLQIGATYVEIGAPNADGSAGQNAQQIVLDFGTNASAIHVYSTRNGGLAGQEPVMLKANHASNVLIVDSGNVGVGTSLPGLTGSIPVMTVNRGAVLNVAAGYTGWLITNLGGTVNTNGAGTLLNNLSGTAFTKGTGAITTINAGGTCTLSHRPATMSTTLNVLEGGIADLSADPRATIITNTNLYDGATLKVISATQITFTNGVKTVECGPADVKIFAGINVTLTLA